MYRSSGWGFNGTCSGHIPIVVSDDSTRYDRSATLYSDVWLRLADSVASCCPKVEEHVRDQQARQKTYHDKRSHTREFCIGQNVWARNLREGPRWLQAHITEQRGPVSYLVKIPNRDCWRRHVDMLRAGCEPQPTDESPEPDELSESSETVKSAPPWSI